MSLCINCVADPSFFKVNKLSPPSEKGYCIYCGTSDVPILRLRGITNEARSSQLTWERWCHGAREGTAGISEYADMLYDLMVDLKRLSTLLKADTVLFRARRGYVNCLDGGKRAYEGQEIGAPPQGSRRAGRANGEGESVLYCTDQEPTAVAEVRPGRGQLVSICQARVITDIPILDLSATPDQAPLPPDKAYSWLEILGFLRAFEAELAKPLERDDDPSDYIPCQLFARSVESDGVLGLRYRSSMYLGGTNVVLFDTSRAKILDSKLVQVTHAQIGYELRPRKLFLPQVVE